MMRSSRPQFKYLIFSALLYYSPTNAICYWPNGDTTPEDVACRDDSDDSPCCSPGFACLDNGLCKTTPHVDLIPSNLTYVRGSCTDQSWKSSRCPNWCVNGDEPFGDIMDGPQGLYKCNQTGIPAYYCADSVGGNCTDQENVIAIFPSDPVVTLTTIGFEETTTLTSTSQSTRTTYVVSSRSTMSSTTSMTSATSNPQTSASSGATIIASKQSPNPETVGLGAGLGIPLGLLVLGLAGWLLFKRRKKDHQDRNPGLSNRVSEVPVDEPMHEAPQPKQWRREELSGDSWAPSEMPADP